MSTLVKMSFKLLLRNKGFLFFLVITPILSTIILKLDQNHSMTNEKMEQARIIERESFRDKAIYGGDTTAFIVKVYDGSKSELSEYVLEQLVKSGMLSVCRWDVTDLPAEEVEEQAKKDAFDDRAGVLLYLKPDFDQAVLDGKWEMAMQLYDVSEDSRKELFEEEMKGALERIKHVQQMGATDAKTVCEVLDQIQQEMPEKNIVSVATGGENNLTQKQLSQETLVGYAMAIITLGFLFCGVCVAHTCVEEKNNKVYTRMMLTKISESQYILAKMVVVILISFLQSVILMVSLAVSGSFDFGISLGNFFWIIFPLGLIFGVLSLLTGILLGDVMSSNYAVFSIWSISALLAGLYFSLDDATVAIKTISNLMPQKWFLKAAEFMIIGDKTAYSMVLYVTVAYLVVIISLGCVGLKLMKKEETA